MKTFCLLQGSERHRGATLQIEGASFPQDQERKREKNKKNCRLRVDQWNDDGPRFILCKLTRGGSDLTTGGIGTCPNGKKETFGETRAENEL